LSSDQPAALLGLHGVGLYMLRHGHASLRAKAGESAALIARQLGHTSTALVHSTYVAPMERGNDALIDRALAG
jgi:integrase